MKTDQVNEEVKPTTKDLGINYNVGSTTFSKHGKKEHAPEAALVRFTIYPPDQFRDGYSVSIPCYDGGEVVNAEAYDALLAERDHLKAVLDEKLDKETILKHLGYTEGGPLTVAISPPEFVRRLFAELFIVAMDDAPNFQTGSVQFKAEDYELTIRRINGKSPAQVLGELKAELARLQSSYICKCGLRVDPHKCSTDVEF